MKLAQKNRLIVVLGDQLDPQSPLLGDGPADVSTLWMRECSAEAKHVWSHKARIAIFLSAMRHYRDARQQDGWRVDYRDINEKPESLASELAATLRSGDFHEVHMLEPGEWRVQQDLVAVCEQAGIPLTVHDDPHFYWSREKFQSWAEGRKSLLMESFYREMRKEFGVMMTAKGKPEGDKWNFDKDNRQKPRAQDLKELPEPLGFGPDKTTKQVIADVENHFPDHPGRLEYFDWPVTPEDAELALQDFVTHRLPNFGALQDAMWTDEPYFYHSLLAAAMNLKLINPRRVVKAAEDAYRARRVPINCAEGFIRQVLGWREYIRGIYWLKMPEYAEGNALAANAKLPDFFWTGDTKMNCMAQTIRQTLDHGYAHHIQRLMITGLFSLIAGVDPKQVHEWYLAVYVDAVEWVELPNVIGMSQYADGGFLGSKPYCASGKYIQRMSNYCEGCVYDPAAKDDSACPFTALYWDFLIRHYESLKKNHRMGMQLRNVERLDGAAQQAWQRKADEFRNEWGMS